MGLFLVIIIYYRLTLLSSLSNFLCSFRPFELQSFKLEVLKHRKRSLCLRENGKVWSGLSSYCRPWLWFRTEKISQKNTCLRDQRSDSLEDKASFPLLRAQKILLEEDNSSSGFLCKFIRAFNLYQSCFRSLKPDGSIRCQSISSCQTDLGVKFKFRTWT